MANDFEGLASYRRCVERLARTWPAFRAKRSERLAQERRHGTAAEKVAENIVEDLFTGVLDWPLGDLNNQVDRADIILSRNGMKYLLLEVKRPRALAWSQRSVERALDQARRYADEQHVQCVGVSDGRMLYAGDVAAGGLRDRAFIDLDADAPSTDLWWLSVHGIYRPRPTTPGTPRMLPPAAPEETDDGTPPDALLHPTYQLPARCFACVGHAGKTSTWRLPYRLADGSVDLKRLPKAIQALLSNYRGKGVKDFPEDAMRDVLATLAAAVATVGRMPAQSPDTAPAYHLLASALEQRGIPDPSQRKEGIG